MPSKSPPTSSQLESLLHERIKPELNYLYTQPPFNASGGLDFGWFCREHAYHTFFVLKMLGLDCTIKEGDIEILDDQGMGASTFDTTDVHYWVQTAGRCPIDLSVTLEHICPDLPRIPLIFGTGKTGDYFVEYETNGECNETDIQHNQDLVPIRYAERDTLRLTPAELIENPYTFFPKPRKGGLATAWGSDIFDRISVHLFRIAIGNIGPYFPYVKPANKAFQRIATKNPEATRIIRDALSLN